MKEGRQCKAKAKSTGKRCGRAAAKGALVCVKHGAAAPQVKRKAAEREAHDKAMATARRMVAMAGVEMDPLQHLLESLHTAYQLQRVWGEMVAAIDDAAEKHAAEHGLTRGDLSYREADPESHDELVVFSCDRMMALNRHGEAQIHPYVTEYQHAVERRAKFAKLCIDAGIAERQVRMVEAQVELVQRAFEAALDSAKLSAPQRQEARKTYARHLRLAS